MPIIEGTCPDCGEPIEIRFGQSARHWGNDLGWWESYRCENCDSTIEVDGGGEMPEEFRRQLIEEEGLWQVSLPNDLRMNALVLKGLRAVMRLSLEDVTKMKQNPPSTIAEGTKAEMEYLRNKMSNEGVRTLLSRSNVS